MAKRSKMKKFGILCVVALAIFGAYTLYNKYKGNDTVTEVTKRVERAGKALTSDTDVKK